MPTAILDAPTRLTIAGGRRAQECAAERIFRPSAPPPSSALRGTSRPGPRGLGALEVQARLPANVTLIGNIRKARAGLSVDPANDQAALPQEHNGASQREPARLRNRFRPGGSRQRAERYARVQVGRLMKALSHADFKLEKGDIRAFGPYLKIISELDRYHKFAPASPRPPPGARRACPRRRRSP